jgi:hypothetical protein
VSSLIRKYSCFKAQPHEGAETASGSVFSNQPIQICKHMKIRLGKGSLHTAALPSENSIARPPGILDATLPPANTSLQIIIVTKPFLYHRMDEVHSAAFPFTLSPDQFLSAAGELSKR